MIPMKKSTSSKTRIADDRHLEQLAAHHAEVLDREAVDVVERLQLLADVRLPAIEVEAGADEREQPRRVHVADDLQRVLGPVGQLVHVDEQRVHLPRGARVMPSEERVVPARLLLDVGVDARQRVVEQLVVIAELQELGVGELDDLERRLRAGGQYRTRTPRSTSG